jgi:hypothetical protein
VTAWRDKSGNGNNATATGSPALTQNAINGVQAISTAIGTYFLGPISMSGPSLTCFAIATTNVTLPNNRTPRADQRLVSLANGANRDFDSTGGVIPLFNWDQTSMIGAFNNNLGNVNSNTIVTGTPFMAVSRFDGTTASLWFNGAPGSFPSSPSTNSFTITKYGIGNQANPTIEFWSGFFGEIILFNTALTTSQRQQVEGYLAAKWGLGMNLPTTHPYSSVIPVLPTQIPGLQLWLDAADTSTITGTSAVSAWRNKGTAGGSASTTSGTINSTSATINGLPTLSFGTDAYMTASSMAFAQTTRTVFIVVKIGAAGVRRNFLLGTPASTSTINVLAFSYFVSGVTDLQLSLYGTNRYRAPTLSPTIFNTSSIICMTTLATNAGIFVNGVKQTLNVTNTTPYGTGTTTSQTIGGLSTETSNPFDLGEAMIFDGNLTDSQRQQVEQYLGQKWGIGVTNTTVAPGRYLIPTNRPFYPTDIPGCALWLDGADRTSMVFSPGTSNVTTWRDKSGNGLNATQRSGKDAGVYSSTSNCINFTTATTAYDTSYPANPTSETMFVVANNASPSAQNNAVIGGPRGSRSLSFGYSGLSPAATGRHGYINTREVWLASTPASSYTSGQTAIVSGYVSGGSTFISTQGGTMSSGVTITIPFSNVNTVIGIDSTDNNIYFTGSVMEIIFYNNTVLSTSQRQQVEGYLAWKWGLVVPLATGHPGKLLPAFSTNFTPKLISGCSLWLDGADQSSMTFSSGSSVSSWNDKSGNGYNFTNNGGSTNPTTDPTMGLLFTTVRSFANSSIPIPSNYTLFLVGNLTSRPNSYGRMINMNTTTDGFGFLGTFNNSFNFATFTGSGGGTWYDTNSNTPTNTVASSPNLSIMAMTINGTSLTPFFNGTILNSKTNSGSTASTTGMCLNGISFAGQGVNAHFAEVFLFNSPLSTSQRQQVEGHLAWKWGLQSNLPSTHAYAKFSP